MSLLVSMYRGNNNILLQLFGGEPIKLRWGAWVSDTYLLQREGWKFHAEEHFEPEFSCHKIRLAVTSPDQYVIISGYIRISMHELIPNNYYNYNRWVDRPVEMQQFTAKDVFRVTDRFEIDSWSNLSEVDITRPTMARERDIAMRDFKFLSPATGTQVNEIYIPEKNVDDLFNEILKIQYPQQQEIKKGLIMPEAKPIIQAKIFSLAA